MSQFKDVYLITLKECRASAKKRLRKNEEAYNSLKNKDSEYAIAIKGLQDLHRQVAEIFDNAPDDIFEEDKPF